MLPECERGTPLWAPESYQNDSSGNIRQLTLAVPGSEKLKQYTYDADSRITSAIVPTAPSQVYQGYAYDPYGNLIRMYRGNDAASATYLDYTANLRTNRLQGAVYDDAGDLTSYQGVPYSWDIFGQMADINAGNENWTPHIYDAAGERVWSWRLPTSTDASRIDGYDPRGLDGKVLTHFTKTTPTGGASTYTWKDYVYREGQLPE